MCAILDANVAGQVFGKGRPEPAVKFVQWINAGPERLVVGGKLSTELAKTRAREWVRQALLAGRARRVSRSKVDARAKALKKRGQYRSDDPHILALAQVSGARLLYSNDHLLQKDFKDKRLIDNPRGKVYSTRQHVKFRKSHKQLLGNRDLCRDISP